MDFCRGDEEQACHANDEQKQSLSASHVPLLFFWTRLANTDFLIRVLFVFIVPPEGIVKREWEATYQPGQRLAE